MIEIKLRRGTFQHIESELYAYHETKKEILRLKNEIIHASSHHDDTVGGSRGNLPGDPTGKTAILLVTHRRIEQLEKIVEAIEAVYEALPEGKQKLVRTKYWTKPQTLTWEGIAQKLHVSRRTAINWRDEIVFAIAERLGWR